MSQNHYNLLPEEKDRRRVRFSNLIGNIRRKSKWEPILNNSSSGMYFSKTVDGNLIINLNNKVKAREIYERVK